MTTLGELLDETYRDFDADIESLPQVWGVAFGVVVGWLLYVLPSEMKQALR